MSFVWALLFAIGVHPYPAGTPWTYQLWSGFIPALAILSIIGGVWSHYRHVNCHVERCWRVGKYQVGPYLVCHRHHPADTVKKTGVTYGEVLRAHREGA